MYQDTITLFNRKDGGRGQGDIWLPTVIKNVNLVIDKAVINAQYGPESRDNAVLNVRYKMDGGNVMVAGKPWMPPMEWDKTMDSLTFAEGDFFWAGEWNGGIAQDTDYGDESFYNYMNRTKDYVFAITSVSKLSVIPHFEIVGK